LSQQRRKNTHVEPFAFSNSESGHIQVFIDTLVAQRPNNLIKQEKVLKHVNNAINLRNEEKGQAH